MRILVTNDDGIHATGLTELARALCRVGEVLVVAPERQQSAGGHAITLHKPLRLDPVALPDAGCPAYATNGTPADCVVLGCLAFPAPPDLVVSGINAGANMGEEVLYSGTASAAMEAAINGVPAFAISVTAYSDCIYEPAAGFAVQLAQHLSEVRLPPDCFLNVNVPNCPVEEIGGVSVTRLGRRSYVNELSRREDPHGRAYYWFTGEAAEIDSGPGTDIGEVAANRISVTPVHFDLTSYSHIESLDETIGRLRLEAPGGK